MRNIVLTGVLLFSSSCGVNAEPINHDSTDVNGNVSLLANQCGYILDKNILSEISVSLLKINNQTISFDFYVSLKPAGRSVYGKLSFGCFRAGSIAPKQGAPHRPTAAEEITQADLGGRYASNVVWQRRYEGEGWRGTIAYVNSVFGDQEKLDIPDYFMICPDKGELACFSLEIENPKLKREESDRIPKLLHGISIDDSRKVVPDTTDKQ